ncbi:Transmembrane protein 45B [Paragonimus heterotremus]|uniref:Transmembrane protein 45B n=1 Tax=Paragonimus heterotremus TaxID=100268 RepID=A0A8J4WTP1_9TREM|nr:Transmembrane protein 45B [Paragonimus heterotremus]
MGTFAGHALPGSFFIFFGLWATYHALRRFYRRRAYELHLSQEPTSKYSNRVSFPLECERTGCCNSKQIPLDSWLKTVTCVIGIIGEVYTGFDHNWQFVHIGNAQHSTMFATFGLSGIVELLMFYGLIKTSIQVEYIFCFVALLCEGFLFLFHLHGRTPLDVYVHMLLLGMIIITIMIGFGEIACMNQPIYTLIRNWCLLVQGTWFWQVGAILYPTTRWMPLWDELAKQSIPRAANLFCYHLLIDFAVILVLASVMSLRLGCITARSTGEGHMGVATHMTRPVHTVEENVVEMQEAETVVYTIPNSTQQITVS